MTEEQIKHMVGRFLSWKLPENFNPDGGISFKKIFNEHTPHPMRSEPSGTNLFDADQTDKMLRYLIDGINQSDAFTAPKLIVDRGTAELFERQPDGSYRATYKLQPIETCSTCGGKKRVAAPKPNEAKAWEVPCPDCA